MKKSRKKNLCNTSPKLQGRKRKRKKEKKKKENNYFAICCNHYVYRSLFHFPQDDNEMKQISLLSIH